MESAATGVPTPHWVSVADLPRAHGEPLGSGRIRVHPEDFRVEEILGFDPDGEGDHLLLWVRKTSANTEWAARKLAALVKAPVSAVGYAGLKDRHAVTSQWLSVPRPRDAEPDWSSLEPLGLEVLGVYPHRRKLRRGALTGNRFCILVRDFFPEPADLETRVQRIRERGVPNYFGEQRFGRDDSNLFQAHRLLTGAHRRAPRHERSLWLSAARSQVFNAVLAERVAQGDWDCLLPGECAGLDGSRSFFQAEQIDEALRARARALDVHPTGPLWGEGELASLADALELEQRICNGFRPWLDGLARAGLRQERRALRLKVEDLQAVRTRDGARFELRLPAGSFATAVLRELVLYDG